MNRSNFTPMRGAKIALWGWRGGLGLLWLGIALGVIPSPTMNWLVDAEVWLTNHVPDPILLAFITGLLISTWVLPEVWKLLRKHISGVETARATLARLRTEGVALRNEMTDENNWAEDHEWQEWESRVSAWTERAIVAVRLLSEADAEWFRTLDTVPKPRISPSIAPWDETDNAHKFAMLDYRLLRLDQLIQYFRGQ